MGEDEGACLLPGWAGAVLDSVHASRTQQLHLQMLEGAAVAHDLHQAMADATMATRAEDRSLLAHLMLAAFALADYGAVQDKTTCVAGRGWWLRGGVGCVGMVHG